MKPITWTPAHDREAAARLHELAAKAIVERAGARHALRIGTLIAAPTRGELESVLESADFTPAEIRREVRRVDGLATGRLLRLESWLWRCLPDGRHGVAVSGMPGDEAGARRVVAELRAKGDRAVVVRSARIKRAR